MSDASRSTEPTSRPNPIWFWLPTVSVVAGAWAFADPSGSEQWLQVATALALTLGGWFLFWHAITATDWATPLSTWRGWQKMAAGSHLPYQQEGTPGASLHRSIHLAREWWSERGRAALLPALRMLSISLIVSILLAAALGREALLLTSVFLAWAEMTALWHDGKGRAGAGWSGLALVSLPWWLGSSLGAGDAGLPALTGLALGILAGFFGGATPLAVLGPLLAASFLVWQGSYLIAGLLLLCAVPGLLLLMRHPGEGTYRRAIVPWMLGMIVLMAAAF